MSHLSAEKAWFRERVQFSDQTSALTDYAYNCTLYRLGSRPYTLGEKSSHRKRPPCTPGGLQDAASCFSVVRDIPLDRTAYDAVSYTHLRAHETGRNLVCRLL